MLRNLLSENILWREHLRKLEILTGIELEQIQVFPDTGSKTGVFLYGTYKSPEGNGYTDLLDAIEDSDKDKDLRLTDEELKLKYDEVISRELKKR